MGQRLEEKPKIVSFLIVLTVKNERQLIKTKEYLDNNGINNHMFFEPDNNMGYSAICSEPVYGKDREFFKRFRLWKMA